MNNHESYVSLETAQLLKQAGFDWEADTYYQHGILRDGWCSNKNKEDMITCSAPTLSVAQKWLREVKGVEIEVQRYESPHPVVRELFEALYDKVVKRKFAYSVNVLDENDESLYDEQDFDTYESALEAGINKCLTLLLKEE